MQKEAFFVYIVTKLNSVLGRKSFTIPTITDRNIHRTTLISFSTINASLSNKI